MKRLRLSEADLLALCLALHWAEAHEAGPGEEPDPDFEKLRFRIIEELRRRKVTS
jgi:hypothetical protein